MVPIELGSVEYPSSEHAYQAAKTKDRTMRRKIACKKTAWEAKRLGQQVKLREDWEERKVEIMYRILRAKFTQHKELKQKLLDTGDAELIEGNSWKDYEWGVCEGKGKNLLGKLLMLLRDELR
jgi:ribA/ribD-fused uncharacterized protein